MILPPSSFGNLRRKILFFERKGCSHVRTGCCHFIIDRFMHTQSVLNDLKVGGDPVKGFWVKVEGRGMEKGRRWAKAFGVFVLHTLSHEVVWGTCRCMAISLSVSTSVLRGAPILCGVGTILCGVGTLAGQGVMALPSRSHPSDPVPFSSRWKILSTRRPSSRAYLTSRRAKNPPDSPYLRADQERREKRRPASTERNQQT